MWFLENLYAGAQVYKHVAGWLINGQLRVAAMAQAIVDLQIRHEALRTRFEFADGLWQLIDETPSTVLEMTRGDPSQIAEITGEFASQKFDLSEGPLFAARLVDLGEGGHLLLLGFHHLILDGWSLGIVTRELGQLYEARLAGRPCELAPPEIQFADFAAWQREGLAGSSAHALREHWGEKLRGAPPRTEIEPLKARPARPTFKGASVRFDVDPYLRSSIDMLAKSLGTTAFTVFFAGFGILLHLQTSQDRVVIGTPVAGRSRAEVESTVGFFADTAVLDLDFADDPQISQVLERAKAAWHDASSHEIPFGLLVDTLQPTRDTSDTPIFQTLLVLQNLDTAGLQIAGASAVPIEIADPGAAFGLTLELDPSGRGVRAEFLYAEDLYERWLIDHLIGSFIRILQCAVRDPSLRTSQIPPADREQNTRALASAETGPVLGGPATVVDIFDEVAGKRADSPAIACGGSTTSYGELAGRARWIAASLLDVGVDERAVGVHLPRGAGLIAAMIGVMKAGGVYLPLDLAHPPARLEHMVRDSDACVVITDGPNSFDIDVPILDIENLGAAASSPFPEIDPSHASYIIYTSGSTGVPKGVVLEHQGLTNLALAQIEDFDLEASSKVLQFAPVSFDASISEIFTTLLSGAELHMGGKIEFLPGANLERELAERRITAVTLPPSAAMLLDPDRLGDLRTLIVAGEPCPRELAAKWAGRVRFINAYGPTEATVCATMTRGSAAGGTSIGRPISGARVVVLDRYGNLCPQGIPGEIHIGGAGVARGYLNLPELTATKFVPDPDGGSGSRLYATGDRGRLMPSGDFDFLGRLDAQVKHRGARLELEEIESVLLQHPSVKAAAAALKGSGDLLTAYVVTSERVDQGDMRRLLGNHLPETMIPAFIVPVDGIPTTLNGKVDRAALPEPEVAGGALPASKLEARVAAIWKRVLGCDRVGVTDKFFELGGDSLKIVQLHEELDKFFPGKLSVGDLFQLTTVRDISERIATRPGEKRKDVVGIEL